MPSQDNQLCAKMIQPDGGVYLDMVYPHDAVTSGIGAHGGRVVMGMAMFLQGLSWHKSM